MADEITESPSGPQYQLTADQLNAFTEAFNVFGKGGMVSTSEIGRLLRAVGQNPTEAAVQRISVASDVNGTHLLDLDAWLRLCERECGDFVKEENLLEIFRAFDKDASGSLSLGQLRSILLFYGERISEDQADEFVDWALAKCAKSPDAPPDRVNYEILVKELLARDPDHAVRSARLAEARRAKEEQELASLRRPPSPRKPTTPRQGGTVYENLYSQHFRQQETMQARREAQERVQREAIDQARKENMPTRHPSPAKSVVGSAKVSSSPKVSCDGKMSSSAKAVIGVKGGPGAIALKAVIGGRFDMLNGSRISRVSEAPRLMPLRDMTGEKENVGGKTESVAASRRSGGSALPSRSEAGQRLYAEDASRKAKVERLRELSIAREKAEIDEAKLRLKVEIQKSKPVENKKITAVLDAALKGTSLTGGRLLGMRRSPSPHASLSSKR